jgi:hypothetical protein
MIQLLAGTPELGKLSDEPGEILGYPFRGTCVGVGLAYLVAGARDDLPYLSGKSDRHSFLDG